MADADGEAARQEERRKRREEREKQRLQEEQKWEEERKKREEERKKRRDERVQSPETTSDVQTSEKPKEKEKQVQQLMSKEEEKKKQEVEALKSTRNEEVQELIQARKRNSVVEANAEGIPRTSPSKQRAEEIHNMDVHIKPKIDLMEKISSVQEELSPRKKESKAASGGTKIETKVDADDSSSESESSELSSSSESESEDESEEEPQTQNDNSKGESDKTKELEEAKLKEAKEKERKDSEEKAKQEIENAKRDAEEKAKKQAEENKRFADEKQKEADRKRKEEEAKLQEQRRIEEERQTKDLEKKRREEEELRKKNILEAEKKASQDAEAERKRLLEAKQQEEKRAQEEELSRKKKLEDLKAQETRAISPKDLQQLEETYSKRKEQEKSAKQRASQKFNLFHPEVSAFFLELKFMAREMGLPVPDPEVVVIGLKSHGKSSFIESLIGRQFMSKPTPVPIFISLCYDEKSEEVVTLLQSEADSEFKVTSIDEVSKALNSQTSNSKPLHVRFLSKKFGFNVTIIDTPGLSGDPQVEISVLKIACEPHRLLVCVQEASVHPETEVTMDLNSLLSRIDPSAKRTIFVHTKLDKLLDNTPTTYHLNDHLQNNLRKDSFWVTLLSDEQKLKRRSDNEFQEKLTELYTKDLALLEKLQFDRDCEDRIGMVSVRSFILQQLWNTHRLVIPQIAKVIKDKKSSLRDEGNKLKQQAEQLTTRHLRLRANKYIYLFLNTLATVLEGSEKIFIPLEGQTLFEEKREQGRFSWKVPHQHDRYINSEEFSDEIPFGSSKVNGAQQLKRLYVEFQTVIDQISLSSVSREEIITGAGLNQMGSSHNYVWAACEIAAEQSTVILRPLVKQLCKRAVFILRRQFDVVESVISAKSFGKKDHPYFSAFVLDMFQKFVETNANTFMDQCLEEFYSTNTLYWMVTSESSSRDRRIEREDELIEFSKELFSSIKDRVMRKCLLMVTKYFVFSVIEKTNGIEDIELKIGSLNDTQLMELFQVDAKRQQLYEEQQKLQNLENQLQAHETVLNSKLFVWPKLA